MHFMGAPIVGLITTRTWLRLMLAIAVAILFIAFNAAYRSERSPAQNDFDSWLQTTRRDLQSGGTTTPPVIVALHSSRPDFKADWRLSISGGDSTERIIRLLDLANAANVFSRGDSPAPDLMRLSVTDGQREFAATFGPTEVSTDVATANLVRLFQIYAAEAPLRADATAPPEGGGESPRTDTGAIP